MNQLEQWLENFGAEKIFIAIFLFFGLLILFMRPPYRLMDEPVHFARAWQISEGIFLSPLKIYDGEKNFGWENRSPEAATEKMYSASVPSSLVPEKFIFNIEDDSTKVKFSFDELKKFLSAPLNLDEREEGLIPNTGVYPPLTYFPQAAGAFLGRILNLNAGIIFYLMGLSGLIFVAACVYWSMKFLPEARQLIFVLAMLPMFLIEAASTSADAVTFGVCLFGTAWLLSLRNSTEKFSRKEIFGLMILAIMLACSKSVYGTILLLYFFIPRERIGSLKKFLSLGMMILFLNLFTSLAWTELAVGMTGVELATIEQYLGVKNVDVAAQKIFILEHPTEFFYAMIHSLDIAKFYYWFFFVGVWGANGEFYMPLMFYAAYGMILIFFALSNGLSLKLGERGILIFAAGISAFAFFFVHYLKWTPVGADYVKGVQGRYFIPIALMIFGALSFLPTMRHKNLIALAAGVFSGVMMLAANFFAFY
ncbi:MAG: DUF2142 domain-containing protein [Selenomonadaceae bacterium]|nr:DUF2142 domain-containing protein [Selenomonadaceae bacterium]